MASGLPQAIDLSPGAGLGEESGYQPAIDCYRLLRNTHDLLARYVESELNAHRTSSAQYGVLVNLLKMGPCSLTELSTTIFRTSGNVTTLVDRMEADGLVERLDHAEDRRVTLVQLTEKGRRLLASLRPRHRAFLTEMMSCYPDEELDQFSQLLGRLKAQVEWLTAGEPK